MKILFVHQNFPGQYLHLARHFGADPGNQVVFITQRRDAELPGVKKLVYKPRRAVSRHTHHYLRDTEAGILNAQQVARVAIDLRDGGFIPDVMLGHNGWGEIWYLKDVFPDSPLLGYFEFFYRLEGADVGFGADAPLIPDTGPRVRTKNLGNLLGLDAVDRGQCATRWQKSLYPARYQDMLDVVHEGINTDVVKPDPQARLRIPRLKLDLGREDEVVTYVARNLEPYRGFPSFMHSLPTILRRHPKAQVLVVGGNETSYGPRPASGVSHKAEMLKELGGSLDLARVHFLGKVPYSTYLSILQISSVHVYLTYPFVLSWSMLEAMSAECVVIGSRTAPVEEAIRDGENGLLVDFFSPEQIADRVLRVLDDPAAHKPLRLNARRTVLEKYDLKTVCLPEQLRLLEQVRRNRA